MDRQFVALKLELVVAAAVAVAEMAWEVAGFAAAQVER